MRKEDFYKEIGLLDEDLIEEADLINKKKSLKGKYMKIGTLAACLALLIGIGIFGLSKLYEPGLNSEEKSFTNLTGGVKVRYVDKTAMSSTADLQQLSLEEIFQEMNTKIFKGTVMSIRNIEIDFNGSKEYRALAQIQVEKVYRGNDKPGETITVLLPCQINTNVWTEDTETISAIREGMTGIFMPMVYDNNTIAQVNGVTLHYKELAECGFSDGVRFAFLQTSEGLVFDKYTYPELKNSTTLDQVEDYILRMIKK